jgi:hypothetical protein
LSFKKILPFDLSLKSSQFLEAKMIASVCDKLSIKPPGLVLRVYEILSKLIKTFFLERLEVLSKSFLVMAIFFNKGLLDK